MEQYNGWTVYETMPDGFWIDKNAGSPLTGCEFIINGSLLKGGKRALLRVHPHALREGMHPSCERRKTEPEKEKKPVQIIDENYCKTVNELARKKFEMRIACRY